MPGTLGKKELLSFERDLKVCQIEHIMPQTLPSSGWGISESNHQKYLHTLGNLSITFDNQNLSNKSFSEKKEILAEKSRINLNKLLLKYEDFDEKSIQNRSLELLDMFVNAYGLKYDHEIEDEKEIFISMSYKNINAKAVIEGRRIIVKKESEAILLDKDSLRELKNEKDELIRNGILLKKEDKFVFTKDYAFSSPSMAAAIIAGASVNGNEQWKFNSVFALNDIKKMMHVDSIDKDTLIKFERLLDELITL